MASITVSQERVLQVPAEQAYAVIADYRQHHPRILPPTFTDLQVEAGGVGAGTQIDFGMKVAGRVNRMKARIDEPQPGRVLTETALDDSVHTVFTVTPEGDGRARVRIDTEMRPSGGVKGAMERLFVPRMLSKIYADELQRLESYAQSLG